MGRSSVSKWAIPACQKQAASIDACRAIEVRSGIEPKEAKRQQELRRSNSRSSLREPANTSMMTGSVTDSGPSPAINSTTHLWTTLGVARSYSAQADVSDRIILARQPIGYRAESRRRVSNFHCQCLLRSHRLSSQIAER